MDEALVQNVVEFVIEIVNCLLAILDIFLTVRICLRLIVKPINSISERTRLGSVARTQPLAFLQS